jgi:hypothetical protein
MLAWMVVFPNKQLLRAFLGLVGLTAGGVHNQGDAIVKEQVKVLQRSMLDAQGFQS